MLIRRCDVRDQILTKKDAIERYFLPRYGIQLLSSSRTLSQANELAHRIRERIQSNRLADGEFFMTEAQLSLEYDVSRTVTREAVSRLQALGILEGRKRKGLIVRYPDPVKLLSNSLPSLLASENDWRELAQLRYALEVGAIELAIRTATEEQIQELEEITERLEETLASGEMAKCVELDVQFHTQILKMTGSRLISGMQQVLVEFFRLSPHSAEGSREASERVSWEHRQLFQAIRDRDVERARTMIRVQFRALLEPANSDE